MQHQQKEQVLLARLKENFKGELEAKQEKIIGFRVSRAPVPERLAQLFRNFVQSFKKDCCAKWCSRFS